MTREQSAVRLAAFCVDERKRKRRYRLKILSRIMRRCAPLLNRVGSILHVGSLTHLQRMAVSQPNA